MTQTQPCLFGRQSRKTCDYTRKITPGDTLFHYFFYFLYFSVHSIRFIRSCVVPLPRSPLYFFPGKMVNCKYIDYAIDVAAILRDWNIRRGRKPTQYSGLERQTVSSTKLTNSETRTFLTRAYDKARFRNAETNGQSTRANQLRKQTGEGKQVHHFQEALYAL